MIEPERNFKKMPYDLDALRRTLLRPLVRRSKVLHMLSNSNLNATPPTPGIRGTPLRGSDPATLLEMVSNSRHAGSTHRRKFRSQTSDNMDR